MAYAAPEVVRGGEATPAADVYSLAALTYHALAGEPPLGQVAAPTVAHALHLRPLLARALSARPEARPALPGLAASLADAATPPPPIEGGFELVDGGADAPAGKLVAAAAAPAAAEGAQVSAILVLVYVLSGIFVLVGAIGVALIVGSWGVFALLALLTGGAFGGGLLAERRGSPRGGLALVGVATQLLWADAAFVLNAAGLLESAAAWTAVGAGVAVVTGAAARRRGSTVLWLLAGLGALVACACLWSAVGPGGRALLLATASGGLVAGGLAARAAGRQGEGLALVHLGCLVVVGAIAQGLDLVGRMDDEATWSLAMGVTAVMTALLAARLRAPGLWAIAGLHGLISFACLWAALSYTGRGVLTLLVAVGLAGAGQAVVLRRREDPAPLALLAVATLLGWVGTWHLLQGAGLGERPGAWAAAGGLIALVACALAVVNASAPLSALTAAHASVAAVALGKYLSTGTDLGPALFTGAVAAAFALLAAGLHVARGPAVGAPHGAAAGLWLWASAVCGLALLDRRAYDEGFAVAWPYGALVLSAVGALTLPGVHRVVAAVVAAPLVAVVPTALAFAHHGSVAHLQLAMGTGFLVIAAAFLVPAVAATTTRQVLAILPALVPTAFCSGVLCLAKCGGVAGDDLLVEALQTLGRVHESRFAYLASVVGASAVFVGLAFLFAPRAASKAPYRLLEIAGLLLFFGALTLLSILKMSDWFYPLVLLIGGATVIGLGVWQRRAVLVAAAALALVLNLWLQYFAKLHDRVPTFGLLLGFGVGLLVFGLLYERRVKRVLPVLRQWA
ncbi:MAG: hypothetical protein M9894_32345 [Planctomycetes bacterium]|nr:hypothetical protein [Planctomycetota bacterium]